MRRGWKLLWVVGVGLGLSCRRASCEDVVCLNGGTCRGGRCQCPAGFSGARCETKWSDAIVGRYTVDDRCRVVGLIPQYEAAISASTVYPDVVYLESFGDIACEGQKIRVEARLTSPTALVIARQSSCNRRYTVEGSATYNPTNRTLTVDYYFRDLQTGVADTCSAVWSKF